MKAKYIGKEKMNYIIDNNDMDLIHGKIYEVVKRSKTWINVIDESGEEYSYPPEFFELIEE